MSPESRVGPDFFQQDVVACARGLVGCDFVWHGAVGRIVETEAYADQGDPACHTFFRPSARQFVAEHPPGAAYVYLNYGVHWLFNVLVKSGSRSGFVLFRALEPKVGVERMIERRGVPDLKKLCAGPGRLTRAMGIDGSAHGARFLTDPRTALLGRAEEPSITERPRVGISRATELPWRFLQADSSFVSRP